MLFFRSFRNSRNETHAKSQTEVTPIRRYAECTCLADEALGHFIIYAGSSCPAENCVSRVASPYASP